MVSSGEGRPSLPSYATVGTYPFRGPTQPTFVVRAQPTSFCHEFTYFLFEKAALNAIVLYTIACIT